jgi:hypothetical protein
MESHSNELNSLVGNEIEQAWYQSNRGNMTRRLRFNDFVFIEHTGIIMVLPAPLVIINRRGISIMYVSF